MGSCAERWRRAALLVVLAGLPARGDFFSPGELSRAHEKLEGLQNCTKCHAAGQQLSPDKCLACHAPIAQRIQAGRGLHGKLAPTQRSCQTCHHEHQGRGFALVDFGPAAQREFDHERAGFPLRGAHAKAACQQCHEPARVQDPALQGRKTWLGLPTNCASCHADQHQGQLGTACAGCHTEASFKPAAAFDHARAAFPLRGAHAQVQCAACHKREQTGLVRYKPLPFASCQSCHADPHQGRLGESCASCHSETSWQEQKGAKGARAFHARTRFALLGAHQEVACKACHGPSPEKPVAQYAGLSFASCKSCHADAHAGQLPGDCASCHTEVAFSQTTFDLARHLKWPLEGKHRTAACGTCHVQSAALHAKSKALFRLDAQACASCHADAHAGAVSGDCARCHTAQGFAPPRFEAEDHTRWPLEGGHGAAACVLCHKRDDKLLAAARLPPPKHHAGPWIVRASAAVLAPAAQRCETCHADPHAGTLPRPEGGCATCHTVAAFHPAAFDHGKATGFALLGQHAKAACSACHAAAPRFTAVANGCASCHAEPHLGQLGQDCARCHSADAWDPTHFAHASFPLDGRHQALACEACHPKVSVAQGVRAAVYRRPTSCEGCHADFHHGQMRRFGP